MNGKETYKKAPMYLEKAINPETKYISEIINLDNLVEYIQKDIAFTTLQYHKVKYRSANPCHLINP